MARRKCSECSKPLGGTTERCASCGGEKRAEPPLTESAYNNAYFWKVWLLGVPRDKVLAAHEESKERHPKYNNEEDEWEHKL